jgi:hypothetical protein
MTENLNAIGPNYGLDFCVLPNFLGGNPNLQGNETRRRLSHEGRTLMNGVRELTKEA